MSNSQAYGSSTFGMRLASYRLSVPRRVIIGSIMIVALISFEIFNFDTTRYALENLLGGITFLNVQWAAILAIAFCAIDFAGLIRLFTPERGADEPREVWYLMGAWLLGATMNAVMTWWAVSLTLLNHDFGNEVLSRGQLLRYVPIFVAVLVWLTRILLIGAFGVAGERIFDLGGSKDGGSRSSGASRSQRSVPQRAASAPRRAAPKPSAAPSRPEPVAAPQPAPQQPQQAPQRSSRIRQRPPMPGGARGVNGRAAGSRSGH